MTSDLTYTIDIHCAHTLSPLQTFNCATFVVNMIYVAVTEPTIADKTYIINLTALTFTATYSHTPTVGTWVYGLELSDGSATPFTSLVALTNNNPT